MNDIVMAQNPFSAPVEAAPATVSVVTKAEIEREVAMIQTAATIAQARPRDKKAAWDGIMRECERVALAAEAVYAYPRGNEIVSDASIHLIRCIARHWGNIHTSVRILAQTDTESQVRALAWDLETNSPYFIDFRAPHVREAGGKTYPLTAPRDIYEAVMNVGQRRLRSCIEALIPSQVIEDAKLACDKTLAKLGPPDALLAHMLSRMQALGIGQKTLEDRLGRPLTKNGKINVNVRSIVNFDRIAKSIEDGVGTPAGFFPGWEPLASRPTGTQTIARTAAAKSEVWPKQSRLQDGTIRWFGRGNEKFDPLRHEANEYGRPLVAEDGTLVGKPVGTGRQRTDPGAEKFSMSPENFSATQILEEIEKAQSPQELESLRDLVANFPMRHHERETVMSAFDTMYIHRVKKQAQGWPQPIQCADGRQVLIDSTGEIFDETKHGKNAAGQPSINQDGTFRQRRKAKSKPATPKPSNPRAPEPLHGDSEDSDVETPGVLASQPVPLGQGETEADRIYRLIADADPEDPKQWDDIESQIDALPATDPSKLTLLRFFETNRPV